MKLNGHKGFTLIEVMVAFVILAVALTGLLAMATNSLRASADNDRWVTARLLAASRIERLTANRFNDVEQQASSAPNGVEQVRANGNDYQINWQLRHTGLGHDPIRVTVWVDYQGAPFPVSMTTLKTSYL